MAGAVHHVPKIPFIIGPNKGLSDGKIRKCMIYQARWEALLRDNTRPLLHRCCVSHLDLTEEEHISSFLRPYLDSNTEIDINVKNEKGQTALHLTAYFGLDKTIGLLLDSRADVNVQDETGKTPLYYAVENDQPETVDYLLGCRAKVDTFENLRNWTPLHLAAYSGFLECVEVLLNNEANVNAPCLFLLTPLHYACLNGHFGIVELLVESGADIFNGVNAFDHTPFHCAILSGHGHVLHYLLSSEQGKGLMRIDLQILLDFATAWNQVTSAYILGLYLNCCLE